RADHGDPRVTVVEPDASDPATIRERAPGRLEAVEDVAPGDAVRGELAGRPAAAEVEDPAAAAGAPRALVGLGPIGAPDGDEPGVAAQIPPPPDRVGLAEDRLAAAAVDGEPAAGVGGQRGVRELE